MKNDSDPDGDAISVESVSNQPAGGTAFVEVDGTITYQAAETFSGTDRFTYELVDAAGERAVGEVLVGVVPALSVNRPPQARNDPFDVVAGSAPIVFDTLGNDYDPDNDRLAVTRVGASTVGTVEVTADGGAVRFTPPTTVSAEGAQITIPYDIDDGRGGTALGTDHHHDRARRRRFRRSQSTIKAVQPCPDRS